MKNNCLIFILALLITNNSFTQTPAFTWAKQFGGASGETGTGVTTDNSGNVLTTGYFSGSADFDPGPGTFNLNAFGWTYAFVNKLDPNGNFLWAVAFGGVSINHGNSITTDASGNVYITGYFQGTPDFDPGAGTFTMTSTGGNDIFVEKLDPNGNFLWAKHIGSTTLDEGRSIVLDASGNVYFAGLFSGVADFDPGAGVFNMTSLGTYDMFICKLTTAGNFVWAKQMGGSGGITEANSITLDGLSNVYTTGDFNITVDFDPNVSVFNIIPPGGAQQAFISKLDGSGNFIWAKDLGGSGGLISGNSIAIDINNNVFTTGSFGSTGDFDPSAGTFTMMPIGGSGYDSYVSKLDVNGNFLWAKQLGGLGNDYGWGISVDGLGNAFTAGNFNNTADFDPGPGTFNLTSMGSSDIFISKLNVNGNYLWAGQIGSTGADNCTSVYTATNNLYFTGNFNNTADFDAGLPSYTLTSFGSSDIFVSRYNGCPVPMQPGSISGNSTTCNGSANNFSIGIVAGATSYTWSLPGGWSGSSSTNTLSATPGSTGIFTVTASNACGTSPQQTLNVTVNPLPTITVNNGSICSGNSFTMVPNGASTYTFQGGNAVVSPTANTSYTVIGTSTAGCVSSNPVTSNVTVNTTPTVSVAGGAICPGGSFTLNPSGANTYTYSGGQIVSPTVTTTYTVTGTSTAGCISGNAVATVTVANNLTVTVTGTNTVCAGSPINLTAGGAATYTWNTGATANTIAPTPTANVTYSVIGASGSCSNTAILSVTVNPLPTVSATTNNTLICVGQSATLTASGASTYTWNPGGAGAIIVVSPTTTSTYTINGSGFNGCSNSSTFTQSVSTCASLSSVVLGKEEINIYPNPFNNKINVVSNSSKQPVFIYNAVGLLIYKTEIENEIIEIDLGKESSGIYFIRIGTVIKKILKE